MPYLRRERKKRRRRGGDRRGQWGMEEGKRGKDSDSVTLIKTETENEI